METTPPDKEGRSDLPSEFGFALAPQETNPAPVVTRSSVVSRVEPTSTMVTRSCAREVRGIIVIPET